MKNFLKGIGIGICIGIPLLAVLLIASHITGWPSFLHKNASMQEEFSQDSEVEESDFTGNTGIKNDSYQESDSNSKIQGTTSPEWQKTPLRYLKMPI